MVRYIYDLTQMIFIFYKSFQTHIFISKKLCLVNRRPHTAQQLQQRRPASHCGRRVGARGGYSNHGAWASASRPRSAYDTTKHNVM